MWKFLFSQHKNKITSHSRHKSDIFKDVVNNNRRRKKNHKKSWRRYWHYYKLRIIRLKEHPQRIARGFAAGVFAGCMPLMGLQFLLSFLLALLIRGNKVTALMGTWISNPFTYVPIFLLNFKIGKFIINLLSPELSLQMSFESGQKLTDLGQEITIAVLLGSIIVGLCSSFISYYIIIFLLKKWKRH